MVQSKRPKLFGLRKEVTAMTDEEREQKENEIAILVVREYRIRKDIEQLKNTNAQFRDCFLSKFQVELTAVQEQRCLLQSYLRQHRELLLLRHLVQKLFVKKIL